MNVQLPNLKSSHRFVGLRTFVASCLVAALAACATPPGIVFPPIADAPRWPPPPDQPRITYIGQLHTDTDLKPGINGFTALGQSLFGKDDAHSMLSPLATCTDNRDRLFVADSNAQLIHVFDFHTRQYATWIPGKNHPAFAQPVAVAWDPIHQHLLVSDSVAAAVLIFDNSGNYLGHLGGQTADQTLQRPVGIAVDTTPAHAGRVLVADTKLSQILVFSPEGALLAKVGQRGAGEGEFNFPTYLAIDPAGLIYVSDSLNFRIQQLDPDLHFLRQFGKKGDMPGYFAQPKGIATDSLGNLYVVDAQFENVQVFNAKGEVMGDFGHEGAAPGEFWLPAGITIDTGAGKNRIYVADSYNRRIQVFDFHPAAEDVP